MDDTTEVHGELRKQQHRRHLCPESRKRLRKCGALGNRGEKEGLAARCSGSAHHLAVMRRRFRLAPRPSAEDTFFERKNHGRYCP